MVFVAATTVFRRLGGFDCCPPAVLVVAAVSQVAEPWNNQTRGRKNKEET